MIIRTVKIRIMGLPRGVVQRMVQIASFFSQLSQPARQMVMVQATIRDR